MDKQIKKTIVFIVFFTLSSVKILAQYEGTFGFGANINYNAKNLQHIGAGAYFHYFLTNNVRIVPAFSSYFQRKESKVWQIDADAHYVFPLSWTTSIYPIAGLNYTHVNLDNSGIQHRLGGNLGIGIQEDIAYRIMLNFEIKYRFLNDYPQVAFMAGIGFWF